jgi:hypothetical protein
MKTRPGASVFWSSDQSPADNSSVPPTDKEINHHSKGGSVLRVSDFGPGLSSPLHRTICLDYGILLAGDHVELELDDGVCRKIEVGDIVVQRGTIHAWHNRGKTWARFAFVLLDACEVEVGGVALPEKLP